MATRGRPRKLKDVTVDMIKKDFYYDPKNPIDMGLLDENTILKENKMSEEYLPKVHHIVRFLSLTGATVQQGAFSIADVDAYISEWLDKGYDLFSTHYIDKAVEGYAVLYILVRKD